MDDDIPLGLMFLALGIMLFLSAFFSGTETALMRLNRYRLRHKAQAGHRGAKLAEDLLAKPDRLLGLILIGNNLVNIGAAQLVSFIALKLGGPWWVVISGFILTLVILIFAEVTPKTLAALQPERMALPAAYVYYPLLKLCRPLVWLINALANGLLRLFGVHTEHGGDDNLTIEELRTVVSESGGMLPRRRHTMLLRILELQDISVDDVMVPHNEIVGIDLNDPWETIIDRIRNSRVTRLPVFRDSIDDVVGVLNLQRVVQSASLEGLNMEGLLRLLSEPYFVPEGTPLNKQLIQFQHTHQRVGFVVDEYGDIQGIVTLSDILEEIVGNFAADSEPLSEGVVRDENGDGYLVNAGANIRALNRTMQWHLPTNGPKTLNGLILEQLEAIPETGTGLMVADYPIEILRTGDNAVKTVRLRDPVVSSKVVDAA